MAIREPQERNYYVVRIVVDLVVGVRNSARLKDFFTQRQARLSCRCVQEHRISTDMSPPQG